MARPNQEAINTFMSITGASEGVALQKLEEHGGDLNEAVNSHFTEGDRSRPPTLVPASQSDFMEIDDDPIEVEPQQHPVFPLLSAARENPFSLLDPTFTRGLFEGSATTEFMSGGPRVTHPREVREVPIEFKDGNSQSVGHSSLGPRIEDVTGTAYSHGPETRGPVIVDEEDEDVPTALSARSSGQSEGEGRYASGLGSAHGRNLTPSAPGLDYSNDIEEEMIKAAIEASRLDTGEGFSNQHIGVTSDTSGPSVQQPEPHLEDTDLARAVSLSLKTAEQEKAQREQGRVAGVTENSSVIAPDVEEVGSATAANGRQGIPSSNKETSNKFKLEAGTSSVQDEAEDVDEQPLVRQRSRRVAYVSDSAKDSSEMEDSPPSSPGADDIGGRPPSNGTAFPSAEWGGISSEEHDEAVMLEAAIFGGIPEGTAYRFGYPSQEHMQTGSDRGFYPRPAPRPPSPTLEAQRLLREQQDDEYLASLQADREKELKAMEEAEARRLNEQAAREAALEEERRQEEESRRKLLEEEEMQRQLAAKEASLPMEPAVGDENAVNLLVRMPDGSRRGRRFLKSDNLQSLFDYIDVGRAVKPGTYRLVRPYPRRAFSDEESKLSLSELGMTSKQEALFLELI